MCFNNWPLDSNAYNTNDFKEWYSYVEGILGDSTALFSFWCEEHQDEVSTFIEQFVDVFNHLAERNAVDAIPATMHNDESRL